jgi:LacI family transcriptional regulator
MTDETTEAGPRGGRQGRGPTLEAVAKAAGVHRSTAARALNPETRALISDKVVERIQEEARKLGYRRDAVAASLRTGRSRMVGVVLPDLSNPVFGQILAGIESTLAKRGYSVLVSDAGLDPERQARAVEDLIVRRSDGLILATVSRNDPVLTRCLEIGVPTVLVNRAEDLERVSAVVPDDAVGMGLAVDHLRSLGHTRIGHLSGPADVSTGKLRTEGFEAAMLRAGLDPSAVASAKAYSRSAGQAATAELMSKHDVTAIAASNDLLALGAYLHLRQSGLRCPADMSIVGHNDMPLVDMTDPPLTTVSIAQLSMGARAAEILVAEMDRGHCTPQTVRTVPHLVVRGSTGPPAK